ncbi:hypothetical protein [Longirhabdus pacifica]|nr:hypothetical protein [Longirhabdus pacifica]
MDKQRVKMEQQAGEKNVKQESHQEDDALEVLTNEINKRDSNRNDC